MTQKGPVYHGTAIIYSMVYRALSHSHCCYIFLRRKESRIKTATIGSTTGKSALTILMIKAITPTAINIPSAK